MDRPQTPFLKCLNGGVRKRYLRVLKKKVIGQESVFNNLIMAGRRTVPDSSERQVLETEIWRLESEQRIIRDRLRDFSKGGKSEFNHVNDSQLLERLEEITGQKYALQRRLRDLPNYDSEMTSSGSSEEETTPSATHQRRPEVSMRSPWSDDESEDDENSPMTLRTGIQNHASRYRPSSRTSQILSQAKLTIAVKKPKRKSAVKAKNLSRRDPVTGRFTAVRH